ncbi:MAG TPA: hypothetical protein VFB96_08645 [Pirellulaceae bacterium]|nr:hypothetical protein [Pirellulaceae bacterium]
MLTRLIVFKCVLAFLVIGSALGLAIRDSVNESLSTHDPLGQGESAASTVRIFRGYPLWLGCGCATVAFLAAFGDLLLVGCRKGALPTYTDEEFVAKFGGSSDGQRTGGQVGT